MIIFSSQKFKFCFVNCLLRNFNGSLFWIVILVYVFLAYILLYILNTWLFLFYYILLWRSSRIFLFECKLRLLFCCKTLDSFFFLNILFFFSCICHIILCFKRFCMLDHFDLFRACISLILFTRGFFPILKYFDKSLIIGRMEVLFSPIFKFKTWIHVFDKVRRYHIKKLIHKNHMG